MAPRKVRLVASVLRGMSVNDAEAQLMLQPRRAAKPLLKLLRSAIANAKNNQKLNPDNLFVQTIFVDQGPMLKRSLPRARGSASPIQKKMSHVTMILAESLKPKPKQFTITIVKKEKKEPKAGRTVKPDTRADDSRATLPRKQGDKGIFKRFFNRKSV